MFRFAQHDKELNVGLSLSSRVHYVIPSALCHPELCEGPFGKPQCDGGTSLRVTGCLLLSSSVPSFVIPRRGIVSCHSMLTLCHSGAQPRNPMFRSIKKRCFALQKRFGNNG